VDANHRVCTRFYCWICILLGELSYTYVSRSGPDSVISEFEHLLRLALETMFQEETRRSI